MTAEMIPGRNPASKWWPDQPAEDKVVRDIVQKTRRQKVWEEGAVVILNAAEAARA